MRVKPVPASLTLHRDRDLDCFPDIHLPASNSEWQRPLTGLPPALCEMHQRT
ncbi:hypothetical protein DPMN_117288 [Dreissena polymorpha]|uniref:Uncharacterized protein n=1 Tax=Dreissena polymorpha TaxID=45954 RepID=A0A9D4KPQ0_DREPO|nr:hypothetical protein DPMN_117288 [Dreissena polymorpha]